MEISSKFVTRYNPFLSVDMTLQLVSHGESWALEQARMSLQKKELVDSGETSELWVLEFSNSNNTPLSFLWLSDMVSLKHAEVSSDCSKSMAADYSRNFNSLIDPRFPSSSMHIISKTRLFFNLENSFCPDSYLHKSS
jgi:hypothetical protein